MKPIQPDQVDAITFDFYNTLVHHHNGLGRGEMLMAYLQQAGLTCDPWEHQVLYDVFERHANEYDPAHPDAVKTQYRLRFADSVFRRLKVRGDTESSAQHADAVWEILGPRSLAVFPEVPEVLARLRASGKRLAVISNWQCGLSHFCTELGIAGMFEHVVCSAEVGWEKPQQEIFDEACRRLGVPADRVLHVGDTLIDDFVGGWGAGLQVLLVQRGAQNVSGAPSIQSLDELVTMLDLSNDGRATYAG